MSTNTESEIFARLTEKLVTDLTREFNKSIDRLTAELKEQALKSEKQMQAIIKLEQVVINLEKRMHHAPCDEVKELRKEFDGVKHDSPCCSFQAMAEDLKQFKKTYSQEKQDTELDIRFIKDEKDSINWASVKSNSITALVVGSLFLLGRMVWFAIENGYNLNGH